MAILGNVPSPIAALDAIIYLLPLISSILRNTALGFIFAIFWAACGIIMPKIMPISHILIYPAAKALKYMPAPIIAIWVSFMFGGGLVIFPSTLAAMPILYFHLRKTLAGADPKLVDMAWLFNVGYIKKVRYIYWPSIREGIEKSLFQAMSAAFSAAVVVEILLLL